MSQRAVLRGFFLCIFAILAALPSGAQTITFSANPVTFAVGETSPTITAQMTFFADRDSARWSPGPRFRRRDRPAYGITTVAVDGELHDRARTDLGDGHFPARRGAVGVAGWARGPRQQHPDPGLRPAQFHSPAPLGRSLVGEGGGLNLREPDRDGRLHRHLRLRTAAPDLHRAPQGASPVPSPVTFTPVGQQGPPYAVVSFPDLDDLLDAGRELHGQRSGGSRSERYGHVRPHRRFLGSLSVVPETAVDACPGHGG